MPQRWRGLLLYITVPIFGGCGKALREGLLTSRLVLEHFSHEKSIHHGVDIQGPQVLETPVKPYVKVLVLSS